MAEADEVLDAGVRVVVVDGAAGLGEEEWKCDQCSRKLVENGSSPSIYGRTNRRFLSRLQEARSLHGFLRRAFPIKQLIVGIAQFSGYVNGNLWDGEDGVS